MNLYNKTVERLQSPTPKKARKFRFWSLLGSALSTLGLIGMQLNEFEVFNDGTEKWILVGTTIAGLIGGFISQLQTEKR